MIKVLASGYFDPIHKGHIEYLEKAKALGDYLVVAVNSNDSAIRKKGYYFMDAQDRIKIIQALRCVDEVIEVVDKDDSVAETIKFIKPNIFAKGGDRHKGNLPQKELDACNQVGAKIIEGLGDKIESSSSLVARSKDFVNKNTK